MALQQKKEQQAEGEIRTAAGVLTLEPPLKEIIRKPSIGDRREYYVNLQPDSSEKRSIGYVSFRYGTDADMALTKSNLDSKDRIVEIRTFYPFNYASKLERQDLGEQQIGPEILKHLLKKWESEGIAGVYVETARRKMQHLLKKLGFHYVEKSMYSSVYFKRLGSAEQEK